MKATTQWTNTAQGPALVISLDGLMVALLETDIGEQSIHAASISLWEGIGGSRPAGRWRRWHWQRDLKRVQRGLCQAVAERGAYSSMN